VILVDSNVLIGLADPRDGLNAAAVADLKRLCGQELLLATPVVAEVCFLLPDLHHRRRVRDLVHELRMLPLTFPDEGRMWTEVFMWLERYAEHEPDWADGYLAVACGREKRFRVWTYDRDFRTLWRRPDGTRIPLAAKAS
jgi:predicted nucleic acid-binding protein